jgi:hypothetical protein
MQASERIFEHAYITNVLGISVPLQESIRMTPEFRNHVLQEQMLFEGWFGGFAKLSSDLKNAFLTFRYIIEDPGRIKDFVSEVTEKLAKKIEGIFEWIEGLESNIKRLGEGFEKRLEEPIKFVIAIKERCTGIVDAIKGMSGWKQAILAISALVGISWLWKQIKKYGKDIAGDIGDFVEDFLSDDVSERLQSSAPLLATALYADQPLEELFGLFGGKKKKKGKKGKKEKKTSVEKGDKKREKTAKKADKAVEKVKDAKDSIPEEAFESSIFKKIVAGMKKLMKAIGISAVKSLATDALLGALSGGVGAAVNFLIKAFGGMKFVLRVMSQPLAKFAGKVKDSEAEMKEAEKGEDDPTDPDSQKSDKKNEALIRSQVRAALLASPY